MRPSSGQGRFFGTGYASPEETPITDTTDAIGNAQMYATPEGIGTHNGMRHAAAGSSGGTPHLLADAGLGTAPEGDALTRQEEFNLGQDEAKPRLPESPTEPPTEPSAGDSGGGPPEPRISDDDAAAMMQSKSPAVAFVGGAIAGSRDLI